MAKVKNNNQAKSIGVRVTADERKHLEELISRLQVRHPYLDQSKLIKELLGLSDSGVVASEGVFGADEKTFTFQMHPVMRKMIEDFAEADDRSFNYLFNQILWSGLFSCQHDEDHSWMMTMREIEEYIDRLLTEAKEQEKGEAPLLLPETVSNGHATTEQNYLMSTGSEKPSRKKPPATVIKDLADARKDFEERRKKRK